MSGSIPIDLWLGFTAAWKVLPNFSSCTVPSWGNDKYHCAFGAITFEIGMTNDKRQTWIPEETWIGFPINTTEMWDGDLLRVPDKVLYNNDYAVQRYVSLSLEKQEDVLRRSLLLEKILEFSFQGKQKQRENRIWEVSENVRKPSQTTRLCLENPPTTLVFLTTQKKWLHLGFWQSSLGYFDPSNRWFESKSKALQDKVHWHSFY